MCVPSCSVMSNSLQRHGLCNPPGSSVHGISQARYWSGLPFPSPGDLSDPGTDTTSLALAFFTTVPPGSPPHLFIFVLFSLLSEVDQKEILLQFMSESVLLIFSSKGFIVSGLTFRSLIHFEFIFVYGDCVLSRESA